MYKRLSDEDRKFWNAKAEQDKIRYDTELSNYTPPPGHDARGNLIDTQRPRRKNKRGTKDPDAPKRASGPYVLFTNEMRPMIMKQFPGIKFVEMGRILGERWRALTPEQKSRYEELAQEDKLRFQMETQQHNAAQAAQQQQLQKQLQQQQNEHQHQAYMHAQVGLDVQNPTQTMVATPVPSQATFHNTIQATTSMPHNQGMYMEAHHSSYYPPPEYDPSKYHLPSVPSSHHQFQH